MQVRFFNKARVCLHGALGLHGACDAQEAGCGEEEE